MNKVDWEVSELTLERASARVWDILLGLRYPSIWAKCHANGLTVEMVEEVNKLLDKSLKEALPAAPAPPTADERHEAILECSSLDELYLAKYSHIARRICRTTTAWIFSDMSPQVGQAESLSVVEAIISRLEALEKGKAPEGMDVKVLDALAASGLDSAERKRVAKLIKTARGAGSLGEPIPSAEPNQRLMKLFEELHLWWKAASGIARTAGLKRSELIRLGLASKRSKKAEAELDDDPNPSAPEPVV